ncbi:hypothetical protein P4133_10110 [Pseudomonas aeruginosa]|nr:hypothetical protein [Pseudomonas aeruginosa]
MSSFTQPGCPAGQAGETVVADNPPPGGRSVTPMAETKTKKASIGRKSVPLAVIGEREDRCSRRLDEKERRKAIVEQRIMARMTRSDVERALGKPDRVSGNNAEVRYQYKADKRRGARSVSFDQEGCVKGKGRYRVEQESIPGAKARADLIPMKAGPASPLACRAGCRPACMEKTDDSLQQPTALPAAHASGWRLWSGSILFLRFAGQQRA